MYYGKIQLTCLSLCCRRNGQYTEVGFLTISSCPFPQTSLSGIIPRQLGDLDALETLELEFNHLEGKLFSFAICHHKLILLVGILLVCVGSIVCALSRPVCNTPSIFTCQQYYQIPGILCREEHGLRAKLGTFLLMISCLWRTHYHGRPVLIPCIIPVT